MKCIGVEDRLKWKNWLPEPDHGLHSNNEDDGIYMYTSVVQSTRPGVQLVRLFD